MKGIQTLKGLHITPPFNKIAKQVASVNKRIKGILEYSLVPL